MGTLQRCAFMAQVFTAAVALQAGWTAHAAADGCDSDADCGAGYVCQVSEGEKCWVAPCAPGAMCASEPTCETYRYGSCVNAPCDGDGDCPGAMLCHAETHESCRGSAGACPPGEMCGRPVEESCETVTTTSCRQPYELPCTVDADCGGGFRCVEEVYGWCMGGGGTPVRDGGVAAVAADRAPTEPSLLPPPRDDDGVPVDGGPAQCGTTHTGRFSCQLLELPCNADADCPSGLDCVAVAPTAVACAPNDAPTVDAGVDVPTPSTGKDAGVARTVAALLPAPPSGGASLPAPEDRDPEWACDPVPVQPSKMCRPKHWNGGSVNDSATGGPARGDFDEALPPTAPGSGGSARDAGVVSPTPSSDDGDESAADERDVRGARDAVHGHKPRGCSVASDGKELDLSFLLIAAGLALTATRRRR